MSNQSAVLVALLISVVALAGCKTQPTVPTETQSIHGTTDAQDAQDAYLAYERGDCEGVSRSVDQAELSASNVGEARDSLLLIHAFCEELAGSSDEATEIYRKLIRDSPGSFASSDANERLRILRLASLDPDYQTWVEAARQRAASGSSGRLPVERIPADFPPLAQQAGIEGYAVVEFGVTPRGDTDAPVIVDSHPPLLFDGAALRAVREWRYAKDPSGSQSQRQAIRIVFKPLSGEPQIPADDSDSGTGVSESTIQ